MLYEIHATALQAMQPLHLWAQALKKQLTLPWSVAPYTQTGRYLLAGVEFVERCTNNYEKPEFGLYSTEIDGTTVMVREQIVSTHPFCELKHFKRFTHRNDPKLLIVAPMSGHYATLLRGTVEHFLPDHEVYITDWVNAREVPLSEGGLSFDDYVDYVIEFIDLLGPDVHVLAVCQPSVPVLVACTRMAMKNASKQALTLTLMGGPVDTRINPTEMNDYASDHDLEWFEENVVCTVPEQYPGMGQKVYPGFIQLSGFMMMNPDLHIRKHFKFYEDLIAGDGDSAEAHRAFYNEYLAVMDLPADFYLETVQKVFIEHQLPQGKMTYRGEVVDPGAIKKVALMTIEGEFDDITGMGQTEAAQKLCSGIPASRKQHYVQQGVGHYGIFNGRRFREEVGPKVKAFIQTHSKAYTPPTAPKAAPATKTPASKVTPKAATEVKTAPTTPAPATTKAPPATKTPASKVTPKAATEVKTAPTTSAPATTKAAPATKTTASKVTPKAAAKPAATAKNTQPKAASADSAKSPSSQPKATTAVKKAAPAAKTTTATKAQPRAGGAAKKPATPTSSTTKASSRRAKTKPSG
ncbi:polyhydroxyalkanoate depolymerase [Gallaecimonas mangrovi]|uniref:polyhydroxyalkanoate depolymerase n=1 Tax=Gallaecimonas mangrovi TaxID=2291597 RepID=UPI00299F6B98|nr:polyhydroxyalkanoate depolymerase [Gallaecimonas mangrovi]